MTKRVRVTYWRGTLQLEGWATTYRGAMRIARRNQNAFLPCFYDRDGTKLFDDGYYLRYLGEGNDQRDPFAP